MTFTVIFTFTDVSISATLIMLIIVLWIRWHYTSNYNYWKIRGAKYETPVPFLGNFAKVVLIRKCYTDVLDNLYKKFSGLRYFGMYRSLTPCLVVRDPSIVKDILVDKFEYFRERRFFSDIEKVDPMFECVFTLEGKAWEAIREELYTIFHKQKSPNMFEIAFKSVKRVISSLWDCNARRKDVDVREMFIRYGTDVAGLYILGLEINAVDEFASTIKDMYNFGHKTSLKAKLTQICVVFFPKLWKFVRILEENRLQEFLVGFTKALMQYREDNLIVRDDLLQLFIKLKNKGSISHTNSCSSGNKNNSEYNSKTEHNIEVSNTMIASHVLCFIIGAPELMSIYMSFCAYELAVNQEIQETLRYEIDTVLRQTGGTFTYETIGRLKYMDQVMNETMRKYDMWQIERICTKPYVIPGSDMMIEKGDRIVIPTHAFCNDPKYFPDPEIFNPERFKEENRSTIPPFTYMPFGEGPRNCICKDYAAIQFKVGIAVLLMHYKINLCKRSFTPSHIDTSAFSHVPSKKLWLRIEKI